jgi:ribonuclease I
MIVFLFFGSCFACDALCQNVTNPVVCSPNGHCGKGAPGDFSYYVFSQLYHPAYCDALTRGYDPTVSHAKGARCARKPQRRFGIHGLWPNYIGGYPFCCNRTVPPVDYDDLRPYVANMSRQWSDPVDRTFNDTVCGLWNHELLKHGTCVVPDVGGSIVDFFAMALQVNERLSPQMSTIENLLQASATVSISSIRSLFNTKIQLACDATVTKPKSSSQILELRTCFAVDRSSSSTDAVGDAIDCPTITNSKTTIECQGKSVVFI